MALPRRLTAPVAPERALERHQEQLERVRAHQMPVDRVNDPRRVAQQRDFISINATTEVDLDGQCASETIAGRYTSSGRSRIRARPTEGSVVARLKNTVDHVVTEWGIARLRGRTLAERAAGLLHA